MTPEERKTKAAQAAALRAKGMLIREIALMMSLSETTVSYLLNPEKHEQALEKARVRHREKREAKKNASPMMIEETIRQKKAELAARLAEIPDDTRSKTARLCGDPLPGRSALDQRRAA